jgi:hypothetical protein
MSKEISSTKIAIFKGKKIRKVIHNNEWWFSVVDVIEVLTDSTNSRDYWYKMKIRARSDDGVELSTICRQLKLEAPDGKMRETDCADTEGIFRIIQSIPSPKAEPFKRWLARVGYDPNSEITKNFYAMVQNKFHFAIAGKTAAEIIYSKANKNKPFMGLTAWKYSPKGRILKSDVIIAKNYLQENQIKRLERTVSGFFDYVENIIEKKDYAKLATSPKLTMADLRELNSYREKVPEYVKDYVPINKFM